MLYVMKYFVTQLSRNNFVKMGFSFLAIITSHIEHIVRSRASLKILGLCIVIFVTSRFHYTAVTKSSFARNKYVQNNTFSYTAESFHFIYVIHLIIIALFTVPVAMLD